MTNASSNPARVNQVCDRFRDFKGTKFWKISLSEKFPQTPHSNKLIDFFHISKIDWFLDFIKSDVDFYSEWTDFFICDLIFMKINPNLFICDPSFFIVT